MFSVATNANLPTAPTSSSSQVTGSGWVAPGQPAPISGVAINGLVLPATQVVATNTFVRNLLSAQNSLTISLSTDDSATIDIVRGFTTPQQANIHLQLAQNGLWVTDIPMFINTVWAQPVYGCFDTLGALVPGQGFADYFSSVDSVYVIMTPLIDVDMTPRLTQAFAY